MEVEFNMGGTYEFEHLFWSVGRINIFQPFGISISANIYLLRSELNFYFIVVYLVFNAKSRANLVDQ